MSMLITATSFGNRPVIVMCHGIFDAVDPIDIASSRAADHLHPQSAALSRRRRHRVVTKTNRNIVVDDPDAIITALGEVLAQPGWL